MAEFKIKTKGNSDPHGKSRVYFTCHPDDFERYFNDICKDVFTYHDPAIYYTFDMSEPHDKQNIDVDLGRMNLFLIPVTYKLLSEPNRAMQEDVAFAKKHNILILPFMMETGIDELYSLPQNFGEIQYLSPYSTDKTEVSYLDKLKKSLEATLISDEMAKRVRSAFDAYVFLSYRKKDRRYANELMRIIHNIPGCRDIAIWYDEFLTPGESWRENIKNAMKMVKEKSNLFTLLVTPNLLEEYLDDNGNIKKNFVMGEEYPEARAMGMDILPTELEKTDYNELKAKYHEIPQPVMSEDEHFADMFLSVLEKNAIAENDDDPEHNFLIGLAYLDGIDVEVDVGRGVELITKSADDGLIEAMEQLENMYETGDKVKVDYDKALELAKNIFGFYNQSLGEKNLKTIWAMHNFALAFSNVGRYDRAIEIWHSLYSIRSEVLGEADPDTLMTLTNLSLAYTENGDPNGAIEILQQVNDIQLKAFGEDNIDTICSLNNLALAYGEAGNNQKALELFEKVEEIDLRVYGDENISTLKSRNNLATICLRLDLYDRALEIQKDVCEKYRKIIGDNHPETLLALGNLALIYSGKGDKEEALNISKTVYEKSIEVLGVSHPKTAIAINNLGYAYSNLDNHEEALRYHQQAYEIEKKIFGENHPSVIKAINNIALAYSKLGDCNRAILMLRDAYNKQCELIGKNHPNSVTFLENLGCVYYYKIKDEEKALEALEKAYEIRCEIKREISYDALKSLGIMFSIYAQNMNSIKMIEIGKKRYETSCKLLGEDNPDTVVFLHALGDIYTKFDMFEEALKCFETAYRLRCDIFGEEDPVTLESLNSVATTYNNLGKHSIALNYSDKVYTLRKKVLGEKNPDTIQSLSNLSSTHYSLTHYDTSLKLAKEAYTLSCEVLGDEDPDTLQRLRNYALSIYKVDPEKGIEYMKKAYELRCKILGEDNAETLKTGWNYAAMSYYENKYKDAYMVLSYKYVLLCKNVLGPDHYITKSAKQTHNLLKKMYR